jgi:serine/threonine-protein kinase RsbW
VGTGGRRRSYFVAEDWRDGEQLWQAGSWLSPAISRHQTAMRDSIAVRSEASEFVRLQTFAEAFARDCGLADGERARLLVILEELFTNVVTHGHGVRVAGGTVAVGLAWRRGLVTMDFVDDGLPFDLLAHSGPDLDAPPDQRPVGGLGIASACFGRPSQLWQGRPPQPPSAGTTRRHGREN